MGPDMTARVMCSLWTLPVEAIRWYLETFVVTTREWRVRVPGVEANVVVHTLVTVS